MGFFHGRRRTCQIKKILFCAKMSLISPDNFQHILRVMNTNLEGKRNTMFAITAIKGVGRIITIISNPRQYKIPDWFLNRQKDIKDGKTTQVLSNFLDNKLREDLERLKKIRAHRG